MKTIILFFFQCLCFVTYSQFGFVFDPTIPVFINGEEIKNPWAGGLNYIQLSDIDYDLDGDLDLLFFDRSNNQIRVFRKDVSTNGFTYTYDQYGKDKFPTDIRYRLNTIDYDNDGDKDLFTYGIGGVKVYKNTSEVANGLSFELFKNILKSDVDGTEITLFVNSSDIPAIADIDFDGDVDILTFDGLGKHVWYYKNLSMETYGVPDSLKFELRNKCWGGFEENSENNSITLNSTSLSCSSNNVTGAEKISRHVGSTLLALDIDNSGVMDLLIGDVSYGNLILLTNGGTNPNEDSDMIAADENFPSNTTPAYLDYFPGAFYVDVSNDGVKDLIVGANAKLSSADKTSILHYKNLGSTNNPSFVFQENDFIQNQMIENGYKSYPVFFDFNGDGLEDLFVANESTYINTTTDKSKIQYYQNTGSATSPAFTLVSNDWLNFSTTSYGFNLHPTFGDLDNDGDKDMLLGTEEGLIHFFTNNSTTNQAQFEITTLNLQDNMANDLAFGGPISPQLFDVNADGLIDLIIGLKNGKIAYYKNIGTPESFSFELVTDQFGGVDVSGSSSNGFNTPHLFKFENTVYLICGAKDGKLWFYDAIIGNTNDGGTFNLVDDNFIAIQQGAYSSPVMIDLDGDTYLELFNGGELGGVWHFEADPNIHLGLKETKTDQITIYPNPSNGIFEIRTSNFNLEKVEVRDCLGTLVHIGKADHINGTSWPKGICLITVYSKSKSFTKRLIKQ